MKARILIGSCFTPYAGLIGEVVRIVEDPADAFPILVRIGRNGDVLSYRRCEVEFLNDPANVEADPS